MTPTADERAKLVRWYAAIAADYRLAALERSRPFRRTATDVQICRAGEREARKRSELLARGLQEIPT